ncbi:unnamed protein product, partial [Phaeothamnion confervicola]
ANTGTHGGGSAGGAGGGVGAGGVVGAAADGIMPSSLAVAVPAPTPVVGGPKPFVGEVPLRARVFSLQKLVEVAEYNMDIRSRVDWAGMWGVLAEHFAAVGSIKGNQSVSMYTIDCLRQLALKFLTKDELQNFNFQRTFLGPFEVIMKTSDSRAIRELVVRCVDALISSRAENIRSGWRTLLAVLTAAAGDAADEVAQLACGTIDRLVPEGLPLLRRNGGDLLAFLLAMSRCRLLDVALSGVGHVRWYARCLAGGSFD